MNISAAGRLFLATICEEAVEEEVGEKGDNGSVRVVFVLCNTINVATILQAHATKKSSSSSSSCSSIFLNVMLLSLPSMVTINMAVCRAGGW